MEYNNKEQGYDVLDRFHVIENGQEVEYCRVKFHQTKHEQIITVGELSSNAFEDVSIATGDIEEEPPVDPIGDTTEEEEIEDEEEEEVTTKIIAISPKEEEIEVEDVEAFCLEHGLDLEAVTNILEGKQKTHRKWRFKTV